MRRHCLQFCEAKNTVKIAVLGVPVRKRTYLKQLPIVKLLNAALPLNTRNPGARAQLMIVSVPLPLRLVRYGEHCKRCCRETETTPRVHDTEGASSERRVIDHVEAGEEADGATPRKQSQRVLNGGDRASEGAVAHSATCWAWHAEGSDPDQLRLRARCQDKQCR
jgi:hypothetical protein